MKSTMMFTVILVACSVLAQAKTRHDDNFSTLTLHVTSIGMEQSSTVKRGMYWHRIDGTIGDRVYSLRVEHEDAMRESKKAVWLDIGNYSARWENRGRRVLDVWVDRNGKERMERLFVMSVYEDRDQPDPRAEQLVPMTSRSAPAPLQADVMPPRPAEQDIAPTAVHVAAPAKPCNTILTYHSGRTVCLDDDGDQ